MEKTPHRIAYSQTPPTQILASLSECCMRGFAEGFRCMAESALTRVFASPFISGGPMSIFKRMLLSLSFISSVIIVPNSFSAETVLITGANRGIGLALAQQFEQAGYDVIGTARKPNKAKKLKALGVRLEQLDVADPNSVSALAKRLEGVVIDILINNAGVFMNETLAAMDFDNIQTQFEINAIAPLRITHAFQSMLWEGSKVAMVTSRMGSISDNTSGAYYGYRASKAALNAFGKSLAVDLKEKGIAVALLHPGFVQTRMVGFNGDISPQQAAQGLTQRIEELTLENSGGFWHSNGDELPW